MRIAVFSTKPFDREFLSAANAGQAHELVFLEHRLTVESARLATGFPAICAFVNDSLDAAALAELARGGTRLAALRSAGFNHVDLSAAAENGIRVVRVPAYSPYAVAEHTIGLILALNRRLYRAYNRVREGNFAVDGLMGFDLHGKTAGVVGVGKIGELVARRLAAFECRVLVYDVRPNPRLATEGIETVDLDRLWRESDIVTLHCPLTPQTHHLVNAAAVDRFKEGVMLVNTSRGGLIDTDAVIRGLKRGRIGYLGLDVYEEEAEMFFEDLSSHVLQDDAFARLLTFPNVLITAHQAFFTREAMEQIAAVTLANVTAFERGEPLANEVAAGSS